MTGMPTHTLQEVSILRSIALLYSLTCARRSSSRSLVVRYFPFATNFERALGPFFALLVGMEQTTSVHSVRWWPFDCLVLT